MNCKKLPHAPENARNFDGEDLVKQCPGEVSARESQDWLSQRKAGCMNFAVYKFIFSCTRSLVPNTLLLADWQLHLLADPCTTQMNWMPKKVEKVTVIGNLQETILTPSRTDLGADPPFSKVILGKPSSSVIVWNFATGWSYIVWGTELLLLGNSNSGHLSATTESRNLSWCCTPSEWKLSRHPLDCAGL